MAKARKAKKTSALGRQARWPSDYGVRQSEDEARQAEQEGSWLSGEQGPGREAEAKDMVVARERGPALPDPRANPEDGSASRAQSRAPSNVTPCAG
jgi:hypothetical protein